MKKLLYITSFALFFFSSCQKAEDKIVGYYALEKLYLNDKEVKDSEYDALKIGSMYTFFYDGNFSVTAMINSDIVQSTGLGYWQLLNRHKQLKVHFVLHNRLYDYTADVKKFNSRELKYTYADKNGNQWTLHLYKRSY